MTIFHVTLRIYIVNINFFAPMKSSLPIDQNQIKTLDLESLINGIINSTNEKSLRLHQNEFFDRFKFHVNKASIQVCRKSNFNNVDSFWIKEIFQNSFITIFNQLRIKGFIFSENDDEKHRNYKVIGWIGKIANIEFKKSLSIRLNKNIVFNNDLIPEISDEILNENIELEELSEFKKVFVEVLSNLSERDLDIITTYANENCIKSNSHLSDFQINRLCKTYNITSVNLRQIKKRTIDLIFNKCKLNL